MKFTKMHGLGNDFIIVNGLQETTPQDLNELAERCCHRNLGIGADGLVLVLPSSVADIRMRILNSDGSEAEMCGNAIRCFAKYVYEKGLIAKTKLTVETGAGIMRPELIVDQGRVVSVTVDMGQPIFERGRIPMAGPEGRVINEPLTIEGETFNITSMVMGVPHTVVFLEDIAQVDLQRVGPLVEKHASFPKKTNVNFAQVLSPSEIRVRTWERGAGATLACGTGSCATVVAAALNGKTGREATVVLSAGKLNIRWADEGNVFMTGPAELVFEGVTLL